MKGFRIEICRGQGEKTPMKARALGIVGGSNMG